MKKKIIFTSLLLSMNIVLATSVHAAIVIDFGETIAKVSDYVGKVAEATAKVSEEISQTKVQLAQGFKMPEISVKKYTGQLYSINADRLLSALSSLALNEFQALIKGTKDNAKNKLDKENENYKKSLEVVYDKKSELVRDDASAIRTKKNTLVAEANEKRQLCNELQLKFDNTGDSKVFSELAECHMRLNELEKDITEVSQLEDIYDSQKGQILADKEKIAQDDPAFKQKKASIQALSEEEDEDLELVQNINKEQSGVEWDEDRAVQSDDSKYEEFVKKYFYDPDLLDDEVDGEKTKIVVYGNKHNKILRERRFLFVNSAAHLMQVSTTMRAKIPVYEDLMEKTVNDTMEGDDEFNKLQMYSNAKIVSAQILLLYARLITAKMQYFAARDLLETDLKKEIAEKNFDKIEYQKYVVDDAYVKKLMDKSKEAFQDLGKE